MRPDRTDPELAGVELAGVELVATAADAARDVEALVLLTEWPESRTLDWAGLAGPTVRPIVVDTRNLLDPLSRSDP